MGFLNTFAYDECGAITVDLVVFSAYTIKLALDGVVAARSGIISLTSDTTSTMANIIVGTTP